MSLTLSARGPSRLRALIAVAAVAATAAATAAVVGLPGSATAADSLLSQGKPTTASSTEGAAWAAPNATDGNTGTRWASERTDPQWLQVDLGATSTISQVVLQWEAAHGKAFEIQAANSATGPWNRIYSTTTSTGGTQTLTVSGTGRYVRMYGTARGTGYGYSLWEFQVLGLTGAGTPSPTASPTVSPTTGPPVTAAAKGASIWKSAGMAAAIKDSGVSWFYTWGPGNNGVTVPGVEFVPMIWGAGNTDDATIARAKAAGSTLLGFNEPDLAGQAQMSVEQALQLWPKLQATGQRLGAPAVAYGGDTAGGWLDRFMTGAAQKGYRVDFIPLHWYGGDFRTGPATDQLKTYLTNVYNRYHKPIWLTEYALMRFGPTVYPTAAEQQAFVNSSTAMLKSLPFVDRYAWFSLATPDQGGDGTGLYRPDGTTTAAGGAYRAA